MCNCPDDDGGPVITAIEEAWVERGGVIVAHCRVTKEGALQRTHSSVMYAGPFSAELGAEDWSRERMEMKRLVEAKRVHPHHSIPTQ